MEVARAAGLEPEEIAKQIVQHHRIGKKVEGTSYRPILIKVRTQDFRKDVLRGQRHIALKNHNKEEGTRFRLDPDLSKEQKMKLEEMYEEARTKSKNRVKYFVIGKESPVMKSRTLTSEETEGTSQQ